MTVSSFSCGSERISSVLPSKTQLPVRASSANSDQFMLKPMGIPPRSLRTTARQSIFPFQECNVCRHDGGTFDLSLVASLKASKYCRRVNETSSVERPERISHFVWQFECLVVFRRISANKPLGGSCLRRPCQNSMSMI